MPEVLPEATGYSTDISLYSTRYKQGGRVVYALDLSLEQIVDLLDRPDPDRLTPGNRAIRAQHAADFGKYIRTHPKWVSPAMILRSPAIFDFEVVSEVPGAQFGLLKFPVRKAAEIHILDGQHRILGIHLAFAGIRDDLERARNNLAIARKNEGDKSVAAKDAQKRIDELIAQQERLADERISVQIMVEEDPQAYRQAFFDIADNALGITASVKARFDSTKVVNRALDLIFPHPLLVGRVDMERDRLKNGSEFLVGAKHVAEYARVVMVGVDGRISRRQEVELKERTVAERTKDFLSALQESFPQIQAIVDGHLTPEGLRKASLLGSQLMLRILAGVYYEIVVDRERPREEIVAFYKKLAPHMDGPVHQDSIWMEHTSFFDDGAMAPYSRRQSITGFTDLLTEWAITNPKFLSEKPKPKWVDPEEGAGYKGFEKK